jgi:hypothetical protein
VCVEAHVEVQVTEIRAAAATLNDGWVRAGVRLPGSAANRERCQLPLLSIEATIQNNPHITPTMQTTGAELLAGGDVAAISTAPFTDSASTTTITQPPSLPCKPVVK